MARLSKRRADPFKSYRLPSVYLISCTPGDTSCAFVAFMHLETKFKDCLLDR